jgi:V8-like Glu-specific endopeptidase
MTMPMGTSLELGDGAEFGEYGEFGAGSEYGEFGQYAEGEYGEFGEYAEGEGEGEGEFGEYGEYGEYQERPEGGIATEWGELVPEAFEPEPEVGGRRPYVHPRLGPALESGFEVGGDEYETGLSGEYEHPRLGPALGSDESGEAGVQVEVVPPDQRVPVTDTTKVPYRWICHLTMYYKVPGLGEQRFRGTGTLIGPRHVLTCGHNLFDRFDDVSPGLKLRTTRVEVTPGYNCGASKPAMLGTVVAAGTSTWVHPSWQGSFSSSADIGLIRLPRPIGNEKKAALGGKPLGFWSSKVNGFGTMLVPRDPASLTGKFINISGYPGDKCCYKPRASVSACSLSKRAGAQFRASDAVLAQAGAPLALLIHRADTKKGHSGSPVWTLLKGRRNIVGVHTGPWVSGKSNRAVRITPAMLKLIRSKMT